MEITNMRLRGVNLQGYLIDDILYCLNSCIAINIKDQNTFRYTVLPIKN